MRSASVLPFNLPPIIGLSTTGGFEYELEALEGQEPAALGSVMGGLIGTANQDPRLSRVFSTFTAGNPSLYLDIDRVKAQALGLNINDIFTALGATLGGIYINQFNLSGRVWQVNIEGEDRNRSSIDDIWQIYIRNSSGQMVPLRAVATLGFQLGPQVITRYNNYRAITVNGSPHAGVSSGAALDAMGSLSNRTLPRGFAYEWTGTAFQEVAGRRPDRHHPGAGDPVRLPVPGGPVRELDHPDPGAALGGRGRARLAASASSWPGSRWTSTRRSAWWC